MSQNLIHYEYDDRRGTWLDLAVISSLLLIIGTMLGFAERISIRFVTMDDTSLGIRLHARFMVVITLVSFFTLAYGLKNNRGGLFIWLPVFFVAFAFASTVLSGIYPVRRLPFRFVTMFYWVAVMIVSYYSVLNAKTTKYHVGLIVLMLPLLVFMFLRSRHAALLYADDVREHSSYFIAYFLPVVLLLRSKLVKVACVLVIFAVVVLSFKRLGLFAFITSMLAYFYYLSKSGSDGRRHSKVVMLIVTVICIGGLAVVFNFLAGRFGLDWSGRIAEAATDRGSNRLDIYRDVFSAFMSDPSYWLMGHGYEALTLTHWGWAHNDFLEILYSFGFIGLIAYLCFIAKLICIFFEMKRYQYRHLGAFAASLVWFAWGSMFSILIIHPYWFLALTLFWGLAVADFQNAKMQYWSQACDSQSLYDDVYNYADVCCPDPNANTV